MQKLVINPDFPVGPAAGHCKSLAEVQNLARSAAAFITVGSITALERAGNPGQTFAKNEAGALNSLGMPNPGIDKIKEVGAEMVRVAHEAGKPIIMSIAGFAPMEFARMAHVAHDLGFDGAEVNLGCPNVADAGTRKPIACCNYELSWQILNATLIEVRTPVRCGFFISVKVSPMDPERLHEIAGAISHFGNQIGAVVTMNTVPNCLDFNSHGIPVINTPDKTGYAGGSGRQVFQQALGQVKQWRAQLPETIAVWGVGGVETGRDVLKMQWAGASVVQIGTAYFTSDPSIFSDVAEEFLTLKDLTEGVPQ